MEYLKVSDIDLEKIKFYGNNSLPKIIIITTGETIAQKKDPSTEKVLPSLLGCDILDLVPDALNLANIGVLELTNIDSAQMDHNLWHKLSKVISFILENMNIKGIIVTHGTGTMSEAAYFMDLTIKSQKPVVFVGSQREASDSYTDGPLNIKMQYIKYYQKRQG